ncbi:hypothetical protein ACIQWZ_12380 [Streptomyces sp. NPDC098077]|uniref:hypothetical protein n=1 Tax=Streptomyces sp. NPDC098077 TaxID=3366093 RepID=UPI00380B6F26
MMIMLLVSLVAALLAGIGLVVLGDEPLAAVKVGGAVFVGCFGTCMSAAAYVRRQGS